MAETMSLQDASNAMREAMRETVKRHSLWYLIQGGLMVLAGFLALVYPLFATAAIIYFLGWLLILTGIFQGISLIGAHRVPHFWIQLLSLALAVVVGVLFVRDPEIALDAVTLLLIVFFLVEGISKVVFSLTIRPFPNWGWVLASGLIGIVLAMFLFSNPATTVWVLGLLIGIHLISEGIALGYLAWQARRS